MPEELLPNQENQNSASQGEILQTEKQTVVNQKPPHKFPILKFGLVLLIIAITLSLIGGSYYLGKQSILKQLNPGPPASPPPPDEPKYDPTADWQTYESQKYNFILKYPESISPSEYLTPFYRVTFKKTNAAQGEFDKYSILAAPDSFIAKDPAGYNFLSADLVNNLIGLKEGETEQIGTITFTRLLDKIIDGKSAAIVSVKSIDGSINQTRAIIKNDGNMYMIVDDQNEDPELFNQILSTFKFTDSTSQSTNTSDWKTYTSSKHNFSIKYPITIEDIRGDWNVSESTDTSGKIEIIGFGPQGMGDSIWGISIYSGENINTLINKIGEQFSDRNVNRENININGNNAVLATVTTKEVPDWISKTVLIEKNGKIYTISNGAREISEFEDFYKSFKFN